MGARVSVAKVFVLVFLWVCLGFIVSPFCSLGEDPVLKNFSLAIVEHVNVNVEVWWKIHVDDLVNCSRYYFQRLL